MSTYLCVHVWDEIDDAVPNGLMIFHLLWVLLFSKVYRTEDAMAAMVNTTQKTYRKWVRIVIEEIYSLTYVSISHLLFDCCILLTLFFILQINCENRFDDRMVDQCCFISWTVLTFIFKNLVPSIQCGILTNLRDSVHSTRWGYGCKWGGLFGGMVPFLMEHILT